LFNTIPSDGDQLACHTAGAASHTRHSLSPAARFRIVAIAQAGQTGK